MKSHANQPESPVQPKRHDKRNRGYSLNLLLHIVASALCSTTQSQGQHSLNSTGAGNVYNPFGECTCACPSPGPNRCGESNYTYCDRKTNSERLVLSGIMRDGRGDVGNAIGIACSDYGILRARSRIDAFEARRIDFGVSASFTDVVVLQGGVGPAKVRVTFAATGSRVGRTIATVSYRVADTEGNLELSSDDTRVVTAPVVFGSAWPIQANLTLHAGPTGAFCPAAAAGEVSDADFDTDGGGFRITRFEILSTNGLPLANASAVGTSGTSYCPCPVIQSHPSSIEVCTGRTIGLQVSMTESPAWDSPRFQWFKDSDPLLGATNSTLAIAEAQSSHAGVYWARIENGCGTVDTHLATVTVLTPPLILEFPQSQSVCVGSPATFSVSPLRPVSYQWRRDGAPIPGKTNATLAFGSVSVDDAGDYSVVLSDGVCYNVTTGNARLSVHLPADITTQPTSVRLCGPGVFTLSAGVSGSPPFSYQWRSNGVLIPGATSSSYTAVFPGGVAQHYDVVVANACGSVVSAPAGVSQIKPVTLFPDEPTSQVACQGGSFVVALGSFIFDGDTNMSPVTFQWRKDGANIPGARQFFYGKSVATTNDTGLYDCIVSNACGRAFSPVASVSIHPISLSVTASSATVTEGMEGTGGFSITRNRSDCGPLTVYYTLGGTASNVTDYARLEGHVVIPFQQSSVDLPVVSVDDVWREGNETIVLTLVASTSYTVEASRQTATVSIADNDTLRLLVSTNFVRVAEGGSRGITVQLNGSPGPGGANAVNIVLERVSGDADLRVDGASSASFRDSDWNVPRTLNFTAGPDADAVNGVAALLLTNARGLSNVVVTVEEIDRAAPPRLGEILNLSESVGALHIFGYPGSNYVIEATSQFLQPNTASAWRIAGMITVDGSGSYTFTVPVATNSTHQFFRARSQ